jgi:hypothetical protein
VTLLAAARLLSGDAEAARVIVDCLPAEQPKLDHGAGFCMVAPSWIRSGDTQGIRRFLATTCLWHSLRATGSESRKHRECRTRAGISAGHTVGCENRGTLVDGGECTSIGLRLEHDPRSTKVLRFEPCLASVSPECRCKRTPVEGTGRASTLACHPGGREKMNLSRFGIPSQRLYWPYPNASV